MMDYANLKSLSWLHQVPRTLTPELEKICNEISGKPFFFVFWGGGPKGWVRDMENARLSFVYVVQANECLFDAETSEWAPAVVLQTSDPRSADPEWMKRLGEAIRPRLYSSEFAQAAALLADPNSDIDLELPTSATDGIPLRLFSRAVDPDRLPRRAIPESRVLPALHHGNEWSLLPFKLYM